MKPNNPPGRFTIDYNEECDAIAMFDNLECKVIVLDKVQVEELLKWYCKEFKRIIL